METGIRPRGSSVMAVRVGDAAAPVADAGLASFRRRAQPLRLRGVLLLLLLAVWAALSGMPAASTAAPSIPSGLFTGVFPDGNAYRIEAPPVWNGTLVLYSHGYVPVGSPNPARDVGDPITGQYLLSHGFALAGSSYSSAGWALEQALPNQIELLDYFAAHIAPPQRTIAWGHSLGGIITAGLIQRYPDRFNAALPMCGVLAGGVGTWNQALDSAFAFKTLIAPNSALQIVHITSPTANFALAEGLLAGAQATPQGRARIALAAALADLPGWYDPASPEPAANDFATREVNQFRWDQNPDFFFSFNARAELEARAGGNPSWNADVDYRDQLERSVNAAEVKALYRQAGLSLEADLETLEEAPRIAADPQAVDYLTRNIVFNGDIRVPVLTLHTTGDGLVNVQQEQAYASVVRRAGNQRLLRQTYVHRAGHCTFTPAETVAAFQTLIARLGSGAWDDSTDPAKLNAAAKALGSALNVAPAAFIPYRPAPFLRPFDLLRREDEDGGD